MSNGKAYAKALMDLSIENNIDINQIVEELKQVNDYFDEEFIKFLSNPKISKENKKNIFKEAFKNLDKNVFALLMVMIDNNNIVNLVNVIDELNELINIKEGIICVEVMTTNTLNDNEKETIKLYFQNRLNKKINLIEKIDKNLVGGMIIKYQGKIIDGSLFNKQESLREYLKK